VLASDGTVTITPLASDVNLQPGQSRVITFQYEATDGAQLSGPGQVVSYTIPGTPGTGGGGQPPALGVGSGTSGFGLGDAYNYAVIDFGGEGLMALIGSPINGNVGVGPTDLGVLLWGDTITGNLVTTGAAPKFTLGKVTGTTTGNSTSLAADIAALTSLSATLAKEAGTSVDFTKTASIKDTTGKADGHGNYVFTVTKWSDNITLAGGANDHVVLNVAKGVNIDLGALTLTGGLTANNVLINVANGNTVTSADSDSDSFWGLFGHCGSSSVPTPVFNGTILAPNSDIQILDNITINGHVFGSQDDFNILGGATINGAAAPSGGTQGTPPQTITETVALSATPSTVSITITAPPLGTTLLGNSHQQTLTGGNSAQWIIGGSAGDTLVAGTGADTMIAGSTGSTLVGGSGASLLIGAAGGDTLQAGSGTETMVGGGYSFAASVTVPGLSTLPVKPGIVWNAATTGPTGVLPATGDIFQFEISSNSSGQIVYFGNTTILSFDPVHDQIQVAPFLYAQASDVTVQQVGANTVISVSHFEIDGSNNVSTITLVGITASAINATNLVAG
jgi:hypothetical protein